LVKIAFFFLPEFFCGINIVVELYLSFSQNRNIRPNKELVENYKCSKVDSPYPDLSANQHLLRIAIFSLKRTQKNVEKLKVKSASLDSKVSL